VPISPTLPVDGETNWDVSLNAALTVIINGVNANETAIAGKANTSHTHAAGDVTSGTFAAARLPSASDTASGIVELATTAEATTGTDTTRAVTPAGVKAVADTKMSVPFADPNADRIVFWDDSAGAFAALSVGGALRLLGTQLDIPTAAVGTSGAIQVASDSSIPLGINSSDAVTAAGLLTVRGRYVDVNAQTGTTYAPILTDRGKIVTLNNAGAITVTLPSDATTAFPVGTQIDFAVIGAGMATFVAGSSATVNATPSAITRAQYSSVSAIKYAANTWLIVGDLA